MGIYNSRNTLFAYDAFWSLYLSKTVSDDARDVIRSYWAQRLMWLLNGTVTFHGPNAYRLKNTQSNSTRKEFISIHKETENLIQFLIDWKCSKSKFFECVLDLADQMAYNRFWSYDEVDSLKNWLEDLNRVGYIEPDIANYENSNNTSICTKNLLNKADSLNSYFSVKHTSKISTNFNNSDQIADNVNSVKFLEKHCKLSNASLKYDMTKIRKQSNYSEITLLVTFNKEIYLDNIVMIKHLYGSYFKHIIFCGNKIVSFVKDNQKDFESFSFIDFDTENGYFHYYCMNKAIEFNSNVKGYLLMSDDVLLKFWDLDALDIGKVWFPTSLECNLEFGNNTGWYWWKTPGGSAAYTNIINYFSDSQNSSLYLASKEYEYFMYYRHLLLLNSRKNKHSKSPIICHFGGSDIFYVPQIKFKLFHFICSIYRKFGSFLELAVPGILSGMDFHTKIEILHGKYNFENSKGRLMNFGQYNEIGTFFHPFKYKTYTASSLGKQFCEKYVQDKINRIT